VPAGGHECRPRVWPWARTLPETVLVHTTEGPSGDAEVDVSFQPAIHRRLSIRQQPLGRSGRW